MDDLFRTLPLLLKEFDDNEDIREAVAFAAWRKIAGEMLSQRSVPVRLDQKQLIVAVSDENWRRHLTDLSGQMIFKLNAVLGSSVVDFIEFWVDEKTVNNAREKNRKSVLSEKESKEIAFKEITPELRHYADAIGDDNLRYQFLLAAGSCLARKRRLNG